MSSPLRALLNLSPKKKKEGKQLNDGLSKTEHGAPRSRARVVEEAPSWFNHVSAYNEPLDSSRRRSMQQKATSILQSTNNFMAQRSPKISRELEDINKTFTGSRLRCLFHRTWFLENKRKDKVAPQHPIFDPPTRERGDSLSFSTHSSVESMELMGLEMAMPSGKTWVLLFASFLDECKEATMVRESAGSTSTATKPEDVFDIMLGDGAVDIESPVDLETVEQLGVQFSSLVSLTEEGSSYKKAGGDHLGLDSKRDKPRSSSSIFEQVTEQFEERNSPILSAPTARRPSPSLSMSLAIKEKEKELSASYSASAAIPIVKSPSGEPVAVSFDHIKEIQLRTMYTEIHNNAQYSSDTASAFLGENLSVNKKGILQKMVERAGSDDTQFERPSDAENQSFPASEGAEFGRSASLGDLMKAGMISVSPSVAPSPCLLKMPPLKSRRDVGDAIVSIPNYSWIFPYVVACAPPYIMSYLASLPCLFGYSRAGRSPVRTRRSMPSSPIPPPPSSGDMTPFATHSMARGPFLFPPADDYDHHSPPPDSPPPQRTHSTSESPVLPPHSPLSNSSSSRSSELDQDQGQGQGQGRWPRGRPRLSLTLNSNQPSVSPAPHWYSLGIVWVCRNPAWQTWEERAIFVCHNYLFECMPDLQHGIIGFAQMSGSIINRGICTVLNSEAGLNSSGHGGSPQAPSFARKDIRTEAHGLQLSVLTASKFDAPRAVLWIRGVQAEDLVMLEEVLTRAQELTLEDVYEFPDGPEEEVILGRGRYNVVRKAARKSTTKPLFQRRPSYQTCSVDSLGGGANQPLRRGSDSAASLGLSMHSVESVDASPEDFNNFDEGSNFKTLSDSSHSELGARPYPALPDIGEDGEEDDDSDAEEDESNLCALKLVSKEIFWKRVNLGKERGDSLVREILSQALVCDSLYNTPSPRPDDTVERPYEYPHRIPFVEIYNVFETPDGFALDLELMQHIDLFDKLSRDGPFSEVAAQQVILQLIDAVDLCNRLGIAHRDIKLSNITFPRRTLADIEESEELGLSEEESICVKLADFGMAGFEGRDKKLKGRCGTPGYVAPDILRAGMNESYDINVDVFSIGVVAYTLLCGYEPFYGADDAELIRANKNIVYEFHKPEWTDISDLAKDWISKALKDGSQRMTSSQARLHPWLREAVAIEQKRLARARRVIDETSRLGLGPTEHQQQTELDLSAANVNTSVNVNVSSGGGSGSGSGSKQSLRSVSGTQGGKCTIA